MKHSTSRVAAFALSSLLHVACGSETDLPPGYSGTAPPPTTAEGPCEGDAERTCGVTLTQKNGVLSCFRGIQLCEKGVWSACQEGTIREELDPTYRAPGDVAPLSLSTPEKCLDNPCDPECMFFDEDPDDIGLGGAPATTSSPPLLDGCAHGVCRLGRGLDAGCDPCVSDVCAVAPECCDTADPNAWTEDCSELVPAVCNAELPAPGLCEFGIYSEGQLNFLRDSQILGGHVGSGGDIFAQRVTTSSSFIATGSIQLDGGNYSGPLFLGGLLSDLNGPIFDLSSVFDSLTTTPRSLPSHSVSCLALSGSTQSTGSGRLELAPGNNDTIIIDNLQGEVVLTAPGAYGQIRFDADGTLIFGAAGTYRFDDLTVTAGSPTLLFPEDDTVQVETCSGLSFQNGAQVLQFTKSNNACVSAPAWDGSAWWISSGQQRQHNGNSYLSMGAHAPNDPSYEPGVGSNWASVWSDEGPCYAFDYADTGMPPAPGRLTWYTNATGTVLLGPGSLGGGLLLAPHATVAPQRGTFRGMILAASVDADVEFVLDASAWTGDVCEATGLVPSDSGECAVDVFTPLFNEPCATGRDCQVNTRCEEPKTGATCTHKKCEPGVALDSGCDECVARICDVDASCCTDAWTDDCIGLVASVCDAVCDDYSCLHQPCETGPPLEPSCDPCIANVCATPGFEGCCTDNWTFVCELAFRGECGGLPTTTPPSAGGSICDYSTYGRAEIQVQGATLSGGWVGSPSSSSQNISGSQINGNATSSGSFNAAGSIVTGDLLSGSGNLVSGTVLGSIVTGVPPTPVMPNKAIGTCITGAETLWGPLPPGSYGDVTVPPGETLFLSQGSYLFNSLTVGSAGGAAQLALPSDGSVVEINACGPVEFADSSAMTGLTRDTAMFVSIYTDSWIIAAGNNTLYGFLLAKGDTGWASGPCFAGDPCNLSLMRPGGIYVGANSTIYGILAAERRVDVRGGALIDATGMEDACELIWDPGSTTTWPACPVTLTPNTPDETGTCVPNATSYQDLSCTGYDLALGIPCEDQVLVCNHGTATINETLEVGAWHYDKKQISQPFPISPDFICTDSMSIAPGDCATLPCPGIEVGDHSLMVDPNESLSECDSRRLDNWTVHDGRSCSSGPTSRVEVYEYEATCPSDTSPLWGLLTWNSSTPGASEIQFSARTAQTPADFATPGPMSLVGVARSTPNDTQLCSFVGPDCPRDIAQELNLGTKNHGAHLELRVELISGGAQPILEDWRITYSCAIDQ